MKNFLKVRIWNKPVARMINVYIIVRKTIRSTTFSFSSKTVYSFSLFISYTFKKCLVLSKSSKDFVCI